MSRASKIFLGTSIAFMGGTIWGVHWLQQKESNDMYQGVLRDEERVRAKALANSQAQAQVQVQQPSPTIDPDCVTCVISPPPKLQQAQTKEQRARERKARLDEYEAQKAIAARLSAPKEQRLV